MKYVLLIYGAPDAEPAPGAPDYVFDDWVAATQAMAEAGVLEAGEPLNSVETATTVRVRGPERMVVDGPFAETKEHLLGFYLIDVRDLDAALDWAGRLPNAPWGSIEVRPVPESRASAGRTA